MLLERRLEDQRHRLGWAFLSILMPLDPGFSEKFAALRGGAELLRPGGPKA